MTEKDTFGDKLRDKEKADEDTYFARRDRELIAKRKAQEGATEKVQSAPIKCPRCGEALKAETLRGAHVEVCSGCHGMWLERSEMEQLVRRGEAGWLSRYLDRIRGR
jgi:hypothetical protein